MQKSDYEEFIKHLVGLQEALRGDLLSEMQIEIFWRSLEPYPWEIVKKAMDEAADTLRFFPKPVELKEIIEGGNGDDRARLVWVSIIKCLEKHGYWDSIEFPEELADVIDGLFGGWQKLSELTWDELKYREKEFVSMFKARCSKGLSGKIRVLAGRHYQANQERGLPGETQGTVKFLETFGQKCGLALPAPEPLLEEGNVKRG